MRIIKKITKIRDRLRSAKEKRESLRRLIMFSILFIREIEWQKGLSNTEKTMIIACSKAIEKVLYRALSRQGANGLVKVDDSALPGSEHENRPISRLYILPTLFNKKIKSARKERSIKIAEQRLILKNSEIIEFLLKQSHVLPEKKLAQLSNLNEATESKAESASFIKYEDSQMVVLASGQFYLKIWPRELKVEQTYKPLSQKN